MDRQTCTILTGFEPFTFSSHPLGFSAIDFWQFQFSNIWDLQDQIAEFIVARALEIKKPHNKNGWTLWDITYKGMRVEVKETAYYHSWRTDGKVSTQRSFSITKTPLQNFVVKTTFMFFASTQEKPKKNRIL